MNVCWNMLNYMKDATTVGTKTDTREEVFMTQIEDWCEILHSLYCVYLFIAVSFILYGVDFVDCSLFYRLRRYSDV